MKNIVKTISMSFLVASFSEASNTPDADELGGLETVATGLIKTAHAADQEQLDKLHKAPRPYTLPQEKLRFSLESALRRQTVCKKILTGVFSKESD